VFRIRRRDRRRLRQRKMRAGLAGIDGGRCLLRHAQGLGQMKEKRVGIASQMHADAVHEQNPHAIGARRQVGNAQEFAWRRLRIYRNDIRAHVVARRDQRVDPDDAKSPHNSAQVTS